MTHIHQPKGLIRYASQDEIASGNVKRITTRSTAYTIILLVLVGVLSYLLITRKDVDATVLRTPGMLHQTQNDGNISNMYNFEVVNKTFTTQHIDLKITSPVGAELKMVDREGISFELGEDGLVKGSFFIILPQSNIKTNNTEAQVEVYSNGKLMNTITTNFVAPVKF